MSNAGFACDTHMHFYDGRYESSPDSVLFPPDATPQMYAWFQESLGTTRAVVVQPTTYGLDNRCSLDGMSAIARTSGVDSVRGVMVIDSSITEDDLDALHRRGVRGARFHMLDGGAVGWDELTAVANAIAERGWHIQLQMNGRDLTDFPKSCFGRAIGRTLDRQLLPRRANFSSYATGGFLTLRLDNAYSLRTLHFCTTSHCRRMRTHDRPTRCTRSVIRQLPVPRRSDGVHHRRGRRHWQRAR